jgi:hypothetical protein
VPRSVPRRDHGRLQASYTLAELVQLSGMERRKLQRLLDKLGVRWLCDDPRTVTLAEFRRVAPDLWDSIVEVQALSGS